MSVKVLLSSEAKVRLVELCRAERDPLVVLTWREPTAELRRQASGSSKLEHVPGSGRVEVVSAGGAFPPGLVEQIEGIPLLASVFPEGPYALRVVMREGSLAVERYVA